MLNAQRRNERVQAKVAMRKGCGFIGCALFAGVGLGVFTLIIAVTIAIAERIIG